ncbi:OmpA family protein [Maritimibacter sp. UBA3975]|uniref:OmpA family protein n=1 Tax=Maritimibacter sp. UBA3975 TaxID=1946833 RepID=UPI0025BFB820|nr:OmpA family protein [Maritimibacter sp. UBA3975]|tara:strand:+ start:40147 stop:41040 length:894 start_codon:yes stop_codon:yes gene_type:complete
MSHIIRALAFCLASAPAAAQQTEYSDATRGTVVLPQGDRSFADAVVSSTVGSGTIKSSATDPAATLGAPNYSGNVNDGSFLSLGCDGNVVLQFTDNALVDVEGPDLYVFEVGPKVEAMSLAISTDGVEWTDIGAITGGRAEVDIAGAAQDGTDFRFVRLADDGKGCGTSFAGADVDAVAAIGSALRFTLDGAVLFAHDSNDLMPDAKAALDELAMQIADANLSAFRVVGHTDATGSDAYNLTLSQERAAAVRAYFASLDILTNVSISSEGRGESNPLASNETEEGREQNRRVEIIGR